MDDQETKAGRRLAKNRVTALETLKQNLADAATQLSAILEWATYADELPLGGGVKLSKAAVLEALQEHFPGADLKALADLSLSDRQGAVRSAFMKQYRRARGPSLNEDEYPWVRDIFDDHIILATDKDLFRYDYTEGEDDSIEFGEPQKVRVTYTATKAVAGSLPIKAFSATDKGVIIGGYMAVWGGPEKKDLQKDYFTPATRLYLDHYAKAPAVFHHGLDPRVGKAVLGHRDDAFKDDTGLWVQDWIDKGSEFWHLVEPLLEAKALYYSPGSIPHLVEREPDGELKAYPIVDDTFTPTPIQIHLRDYPLDYIKSVYEAAGQDFTLPEALRGKAANALTGAANGDVRVAQALLHLKRINQAL